MSERVPPPYRDAFEDDGDTTDDTGTQDTQGPSDFLREEDRQRLQDAPTGGGTDTDGGMDAGDDTGSTTAGGTGGDGGGGLSQDPVSRVGPAPGDGDGGGGGAAGGGTGQQSGQTDAPETQPGSEVAAEQVRVGDTRVGVSRESVGDVAAEQFSEQAAGQFSEEDVAVTRTSEGLRATLSQRGREELGQAMSPSDEQRQRIRQAVDYATQPLDTTGRRTQQAPGATTRAERARIEGQAEMAEGPGALEGREIAARQIAVNEGLPDSAIGRGEAGSVPERIQRFLQQGGVTVRADVTADRGDFASQFGPGATATDFEESDPEATVPVGSQAIQEEVESRYRVGGFASQFGPADAEDFDTEQLPDQTLFTVDTDINRGGYASRYTEEDVGETGSEVAITQADVRGTAGQASQDLIAGPTTVVQSIGAVGVEAGQAADFVVRGEDDELTAEDIGQATGFREGAYAERYLPEEERPSDPEERGRAAEVRRDVEETAAATAEYAAENPEEVAGTLLAGGLLAGPASVTSGVALGRVSRFVGDRVRTAGGTRVDPDELMQESVRRNVETGGEAGEEFPGATDPDLYREDPPAAVRQQAQERTPAEVEETFEAAGAEEGVTLKKALDVEPAGPGQGRAARGFESAPGESLADFDYETPGAFVGPELSPYFLGIGSRSAFSLRPGLPDTGGRPTGVFVRTDVESPEASDIGEFGQEMIERSGETTARTKPPGEVNVGEIEAVVPPGAEFADVGGGVVRNTLRRAGVGSDFYTEVAGRRVPLRAVADPDAIERRGIRSRVRSFLDDERGQAGVGGRRRGSPEVDEPTPTGQTLDELTRPLRRPTDRPTPAPPIATPPSASGTREGRERVTDGARPRGGASEGAEQPGTTDRSGVPPSQREPVVSLSPVGSFGEGTPPGDSGGPGGSGGGGGRGGGGSGGIGGESGGSPFIPGIPGESRPRRRPRFPDSDTDDDEVEGRITGVRSPYGVDFIDPLTGDVLQTDVSSQGGQE